jgi:hypothetical protein
MMTLGMEFGPEPSGSIFFALPRMHRFYYVFIELKKIIRASVAIQKFRIGIWNFKNWNL